MSWFMRCSWCGGPFNGGNCRRCTNVSFGDEFVRNPDPISYDETPDFSYPPPQPQYETYSCELCGNDSHYGFDCPPRFPLVYEQEPSYNQNFGDNYYPQNSPSFPQQYLCCENCGGPHENFQCQPRNQNYFESNPCYNPNSYGFDQPTQTSIDHQPPKEMSIRELLLQEKLHKALQAVCEKLNQQEQAANESTIPLNENISQIPPSIAITLVLPIMEPGDSFSMGDRHLSTIPKKESDEFIKYSVEDLVPIPSESEDTSRSNKDIESKDSYVSNLDEPALLVTPLSDFNEDECFNPGGDFGDILLLEKLLSDDTSSSLPKKELYFVDLKVIKSSIDTSSDFEDDYYDSEGDIIYIESLLIDDTIPNLAPEIPSGESKVHIEVLSVLWGNRLPIPDGSLPLSRRENVVGAFMNVPIFVGNFSIVTDFAVVENIDAYRDQDMGEVIMGKPFCREICVKAKRFDGMITIYSGNEDVTYQMALSHPSFKHLTNAT
ncbi:hypothetical protein Tco_0471245 [Tanacetum coccineum]